jgi:hypothetical protein
MTIDERLTRPTERHEALTQSVEMLTQDVRELAKAQAVTEQRMGQIMDLYTRMGNIIIAHED